MYNYKIYAAPEVHHQQGESYYHPYSTLSYQSYTKKPTYLQKLANAKYTSSQYYENKPTLGTDDRQLFQIQKEQHYDYMNRLNKNLEFDFNTLKNKYILTQCRIESLSISYIEERELFSQMIYEISEQLHQIQQCKYKIVTINLSSLENTITSIQLLDYLHKQDFTQVKKSDVDLFFNSISNVEFKDTISKLMLQNLLGRDCLIKEDDQDVNFLQARIITMIIQAYTTLEQYRQKFKNIAVKLDYIFNWLDFDRDGIISFADFKSRYPNQEACFKFLTSTSLDIKAFVELLQPHSQANYL